MIGAGFAGAACAVALADRGIPVTLWESSRGLGGRATSRRDPDSGEWLDNGPHLLMGCYRRTRALLDRLGTAEGLRFQSTLHLPLYPEGHGGHRVDVRCPPLPAPFSLILGLLGIDGLSLSERFNLLSVGDQLKKGSLPSGTVAAWLESAGASAASVHLLWGPLCRAVINLEPAEAAAAPFIEALRRALLGSAEDARLGWAAHGLGAFLGNSLGAALAARGGRVRHERVARVEQEAGRVTALVTRNDERVAAARVVIATDPFAARKLLPEGGAEALKRVLAGFRPSAIVSVYLWFTRPVAPFPAGTPFVGLPGRAFEWVFERDRLAGSAAGSGQRLALVASAADTLSGQRREQVLEQALSDLSSVFPGVRNTPLRHQVVIREGRATAALGPNTVRPQAGVVAGVEGLFLAGDYTDTGLPATIEGAVESGEMAAEMVP